MEQRPVRRVEPLLAFAISFAVYLYTLCPSVYVEGSGELIGAAYYLGTPHPTGYPLFCLSARLVVALLPFSSPAFAVNLATALSAALAIAALCQLLLWRNCGGAVAVGAALCFGFSATFWSQAVIAEVYGLSMLGVVLVLAAGLAAAEKEGARSLLLLGYLMGLGLTCHLNQVLVWPGLLLWLFWRRKLWRQKKSLAGMLVAFALGYSPVLYLFLRNGRGPGFHWGRLETPQQLWDHLSGTLYRSSFFSMPLEAMVLNLQRWLGQMSQEFHPLLLPLVLGGAWQAWRHDKGLFAAIVAAIGANLLVILNYHRDPNGIGVFFLLSILGFAVFIGMGIEAFSRGLARWKALGRGQWLAALLPALVVGSSQFAAADHSNNTVPLEYGRDILRGLAPNAILIAEGDDAAFLVDYLIRVEGERPDIALYNRQERGTSLISGAENNLGPATRYRLRKRREAELIRSGQRPVYFLVSRDMPVKGYRFVPEGLTYKVEPVYAELGPRPEIPLANALRQDINRDPWVAKLQANYWFMLGEKKRFEGQWQEAAQAFERAAEVGGQSRTIRYNVAIMYIKNNDLENALIHARAGFALDPWSLGQRRLLARVLQRLGRVDQARALLVEAGLSPSIP